MPITQFSRQLVELTESSGGDGVSQVLASYRNSCDGHYNQNGSHNDATMTLDGKILFFALIIIQVMITVTIQ